MLRKQLAAAIGKEVTPADFAAYMRQIFGFMERIVEVLAGTMSSTCNLQSLTRVVG